MKVVEDFNQPGVMLTSSGQLAVPTIDAYVQLQAFLYSFTEVCTFWLLAVTWITSYWFFEVDYFIVLSALGM